MRPSRRHIRVLPRAFTLIETLTVVLLTGLLLAGLLGIFSQLRQAIARLQKPSDQDRLAYEILHKIAEDIDRLVAPGFEAGLQFRNKFDNGLNSAQLLIENKYYGSAKPPAAEVFDRVIWQTQYDPFSKSLILYRLHEGLNLEDKVIEKSAAQSPSLGMFVPISDGITHFEVTVQDEQNTLFQWTAPTLPTAVRIGLSLTPPSQLPDGRVAVPPETIVYRTVAIDRTRFIPYEFITKPLDAAAAESQKKDQQEQQDQQQPKQSEKTEPPAAPQDQQSILPTEPKR